jgi:electron transfer flavoprotein alpha subunit
MTGVLVYSERDELACDLLAWAAGHRDAFGPPMAVVLGPDAQKRAQDYRPYGPERVFISEDAALADLQDDVMAAALIEVVEQAEAVIILIGATRRGRSLAPRLAQGIGAGCINEAFEISVEQGRLVAGRYALGGNTVSKEAVSAHRQVVSIVPGTVERAEPGEMIGEVIALSLSLKPSRTVVVERSEKPPTSVDIMNSERLVCVGRGLANRDDLALVNELAKALGGEVACTRPLSYENDWLPEDCMIGISGKKVSPRLLLSLGVSGEVQHTVGIMGATTIVAVNNDPSAPIFKLADYGLVDDLYEVIPKLIERL